MSLFVSNALIAQQQEVELWDEVPGSITDENYTEEKQFDGEEIRGYGKVTNQVNRLALSGANRDTRHVFPAFCR